MNVVIQILTLIAQIASKTTEAGTIANIIATLETIISTMVNEVRDVYPSIRNIITALRSNDAVTADQMSQLKILDEATDAAFEEAAKNAGAAPMPGAPDGLPSQPASPPGGVGSLPASAPEEDGA